MWGITAPEQVYLFGSRDPDFQGHRGYKGQIRFLEHDSKSFLAINLKFGTYTCLGAGEMPIDFGVTGVNVGVTECKTMKIAVMSISCHALQCYC